ncbi:MAG: PKD domain-containing protein [Synergistaceae bacterium]|nr:PKD domain-containing protein [Synergistaceae bacterium]
MYSFTLEASTADNSQSSWTASGLPDGLALEGPAITGTPTVYGEFEITVTVTNEYGTDTKTFTLRIYDISESLNRNAPEITSSAPTSTGKFAGTPKQTGEFVFTVSAANNSGTRSETVTLIILDVPASMLMFERVCSSPFIVRISFLRTLADYMASVQLSNMTFDARVSELS